ncbi:LysR family transcriptional regulator [Marivita sp. S2033]|uniref:LysR family transcriptional regulator n=1 Tax=Marivita sp. S2033 TaxID=3373187 RepID=UPI003981B291
MDIKQLRYFLAIVEHGSITNASKTLRVAQPALSMHVKNMEDALGTRLLDRSRSGVTPTEAGDLLARRARTLIDDLARAEDDVRTLDTDPSGVVRIGLTGTISGIVALPLIAAARAKYPRIKLNIAEAMSGFISDWMTEGRVDIAVLYEAARGTNAVSELMLEEELVVLWRGETECLAEMSLAGLRGVPMVVPSNAHGLRIQIDAALGAVGIEPTIAVEIDSYINIKRLVAAGFGASILPYHAVLDESRDGSLAISRIADPGLWRGAHLIYPAGRPVTRAQHAIRDLLRDVIQNLLTNGEWAAARLAPVK